MKTEQTPRSTLIVTSILFELLRDGIHGSWKVPTLLIATPSEQDIQEPEKYLLDQIIEKHPEAALIIKNQFTPVYERSSRITIQKLYVTGPELERDAEQSRIIQGKLSAFLKNETEILARHIYFPHLKHNQP